MSHLTTEKLRASLDNAYSNLNTENVREYADTCYNIIGIKGKNASVASHKRTLYVDVKDFITHYMMQSDSEDYGYDIPNEERLKHALDYLHPNEQLSLYRYLKSQYNRRGFDASVWDKKINELGLKVAWEQHKYFSLILKLSAYNIGTLLFSYLLFVFVAFLFLHDAPFECMGVLDVSLHQFSEIPSVNYFMNTLAIASGEDYGQSIVPVNAGGMLLIIIGKIVFYLLIANFVLKKLSDYFNFD